MPRALAKAGFEVALVAPEGSLALHSRYLSHVERLSPTAVPLEVLQALLRAIDRVSPRILVPCDEMAVRLLFALALDPPAGLSAQVRSMFATLITESLGDPRYLAASIDKTLLPAVVEPLGIRMPPSVVADDVDGAAVFAGARGYPVVVKRRFGFAGQGMAIVHDRRELEAAFDRLRQPDQLDLGEPQAPRLLVQSFIAGPHLSQALVAVRGTPLAAFAWERFVATGDVAGQTSVLRFIRSPETRAIAEKLCGALGIGGFFNVQFIADARTGTAYLLEINRRLVTHTHLGSRVGADLARALFDGLAGRPPTPLTESEDVAVAVFPREWLRDPGSEHLRALPSDVPWDEPELFAAMLRMRHEDTPGASGAG